MKHKVLASLLALSMLLGLLPGAALAAEDGENTPDAGAGYADVENAGIPSAYDLGEGDEEDDTELTGPCGGDLTWTLTENEDVLYRQTADATSDYVFSTSELANSERVTAYTLTISGSGAMGNYASATTPWGRALAEKVNATDDEIKGLSYTVTPMITQVEFADDAAPTYIGSHAFRSTSISTIDLPGSVMSIGDYALIRCWNLKEIKIGGETTTTATDSRSFYVTDGVLYEEYTEDGTSGVELRFYPAAKTTGTFAIPDGVTVLGANSLQDGQFTGLEIPDSVRSINSYALCHTGLTSVTLPDGVTFGTEREIGITGAGVFSSSKALASIVNFPDVTTVPTNMFASCSALKEFNIPSTVETIERGAFDGSGITEFTIPASVQSIGDVVFARTGSEEETVTVTFEEGSQLASIGKNCFTSVATYKATFNAGNMDAYLVFTGAGYAAELDDKPLPKDDTFVYAWAGEDELKIVGLTDAGKKAPDLTIPDTVAAGEGDEAVTYKVIAIADGVFAGTNTGDGANQTLTKVKIGANIKTIGANAFRYCKSLAEIDFSTAASLKTIGESAFYNVAATEFDFSSCTALEEIGAWTFRYISGIKAITLPDGVSSWGEMAIYNAKTEVKCSADSTTLKTLLDVLAAEKDTFRISGEGENEVFTYSFTADTNGDPCITITGFAEDASEDAKKTVVIPDEIDGIPVTAVNARAFSDFRNVMVSISIGKNVEKIGDFAFAGTNGGDTGNTLQKVTFEKGAAVEIGQRAFQKHTALETFDAGDREITLGNNVLLSAPLKTVNIPGVTSLGTGVFYGASKITTLVINGEAEYAEKTFINDTSATGTGTTVSFTKATVYVVGSADNAADEITALAEAGNTVLLANGGTVNVTADKTGFAAVSKSGYTAKWYKYDSDITDYSGETAAATAESGQTYIAVWELDGDHVEITYAANDGSNATVTNVAVKNEETHVANSLFTRSGYTFTGWITSDEDAKTSYNAGDAITPTESVTLYAQWELNAPTLSAENISTTYQKDTSVTLEVIATHTAGALISYTYAWSKGDEPLDSAASTLRLNGVVADSGEYTCTVTASDGTLTSEAASITIQVTIQEAEIKDVSVSAPNNAAYDGTEHTIGYSIPEGAAIVFKTGKDGDYSDQAPTFINAGTYTVFYKVTMENYSPYEQSIEVTIAKAVQSIDYTEKTISKETGDAAFTNELTRAPVYGNITYSSSNTSVATVDSDGKVTIKGVGSATITAKAAGSDNYNEAEARYTLTVTAPSTTPGNGGSSSGGSHSSSGSSSSSSTYPVTVDSTKNGTVSISPKNAKPGATVTLTVTTKDGYELDDLTVTDKNGKSIKVTEGKNGKYTFTMPDSKVTVEASFTKIVEKPKVSFADVPASAYYYDAVAWAVENGVTSGTSAATFSPNAACTRAQAVTFLWRAAGSPAPKSSIDPFTDVQPGAYYYDAVLWAVEQGITAGTSATTFSPDTTCTRGQIVTFLYRADGTATTGSDPFTDVADSAYYADAVKWAVAEGVTAGTSATTFSPDASCTRAQIVTFLYRAYAD